MVMKDPARRPGCRASACSAAASAATSSPRPGPLRSTQAQVTCSPHWARACWLGLQDDLDAAVGLIPEDLIPMRGFFQRQVMGGESLHAERVAAVGDHRHEVVDPALDVSLAHPQLDAAVEHLHHRHGVDLAAVDAPYRDRAAAAPG